MKSISRWQQKPGYIKKEALRIVNSFKKWRIHTKDGKAVEVSANMPFTFKFNNRSFTSTIH